MRLIKCDPEHKTSLKCQFFKIEIYTSSESGEIIFPLMYGFCYDWTIFENLESEDAKKSKY